jgi:hypothetical protein
MNTLDSSFLKYDVADFAMTSKLLRLLVKYKVHHLRADLLRGLSTTWPSKLAQWEIRESKAMNCHRVYAPHEMFPHPMCVLRPLI